MAQHAVLAQCYGFPVDALPHIRQRQVVAVEINQAAIVAPDHGKAPYHTSQRDDLQPGEYVQVAVSDSGTGMPSEILERVFDPFFTTKDPGSGTGLGLAIVHRLVHEHGGLIWVSESKLGGALFNIFLPRAT
ncbi:MAG: hypothetical protein IH820_00810 [Bacteroidetes bacterium]|nr:hypothetical protein [Bacteroidota bacterium]